MGFLVDHFKVGSEGNQIRRLSNESEMTWPKYRPPVGVIQPLPGIGDMVWHLPHLRAIAAHAGTAVTLLAKPRSLADQLLVNEPAVASVVWVDINPANRPGVHDGFGGFLKLVRAMRAQHFGTVVLLHHSDLLAAAVWRAGIPDRRGYGWGRQRWFLNTGPFLPRDVREMHQHTRATRYLQAAGVMMPSAEPALTVPPATISTAMARLGGPAGAFVAIGIGSSEALRQWGTDRFAELASVLLDAGWPMLILMGGAEDLTSATAIVRRLGSRSGQVRLALGWHLADVTGLLSAAAFYVGNNTGVMNIAAATGTRTYALFGTTRPFEHASQIVSIVAPDTGTHDGMVRLSLNAVLTVMQADRGRLGPQSCSP